METNLIKRGRCEDERSLGGSEISIRPRKRVKIEEVEVEEQVVQESRTSRTGLSQRRPQKIVQFGSY